MCLCLTTQKSAAKIAAIGARKIPKPLIKLSKEAAEWIIFLHKESELRLFQVRIWVVLPRNHNPRCGDGPDDNSSADIDILREQA